ncbi:MAG: glycosyltransferase, partial [Flavobacteriales bacterium]
KRLKMLLMPVFVKKDRKKTLLNTFQRLEQVAMNGFAAASDLIGKPILCSGANLAFKKTLFEDLDGYEDNKHIASGDDVFFLHKVKKKYPNNILFTNEPEVHCETKESDSLKSFLEQQKRWSKKSGYYKDLHTILISINLFLYHFILILNFCLWFIFPTLSVIILSSFIIKMFAEVIFLTLSSKFFKINPVFSFFPVIQILHIFYVGFMPVLSFSGNIKWKERTIR